MNLRVLTNYLRIAKKGSVIAIASSGKTYLLEYKGLAKKEKEVDTMWIDEAKEITKVDWDKIKIK